MIIPVAGRSDVLDLLHDRHHGISKMKLLAKQVVWWPGMDAAVQVVKNGTQKEI